MAPRIASTGRKSTELIVFRCVLRIPRQPSGLLPHDLRGVRLPGENFDFRAIMSTSIQNPDREITPGVHPH